MTVPDFQTVMRPILVALGDEAPQALSQIRASVAEVLAVSDEDQQEMLPSGKQTTFSNRVAWALTHMSKALLTERPSRGQYRITARGQEALVKHPDRIDMPVLNQFEEYRAFRAIKHTKPSSGDTVTPEDISPSEAIGAIVENAYDLLASELLDRVLAQPPVFLETLALRLLRALGYGGRETLIEHTGKPGDGGLDGIVRQDALGIDLVGVQAKRYDKAAAVQRPEVQAFAGALDMAQTSRGVFVTTGRFSSGAKEYAMGISKRMILIDGQALARLMVRYNVGVTVSESFDLKQINEDLFEQ